MAQAQDGLFSGLSNLPVFDGVPEGERSRSLLAAALQMMQPGDPLKGQGNFLSQLSSGVGAGLAELDTQKDRRKAFEQQDFEQGIKTRQADVADIQAGNDTTRAQAAQTTAEATASNAETNKGDLAQKKYQYSNEASSRAAADDLKRAEAEWLRRRYGGAPGGETAAQLAAQKIESYKQTLIAQNPERYKLPDGGINVALATVDAYQTIGLDEDILKNESLGIILSNAEEAGGIRKNLEGLQREFSGPAGAATAGPPTLSSQEEVNALKPGDEFVWKDGKTYTKQ